MSCGFPINSHPHPHPQPSCALLYNHLRYHFVKVHCNLALYHIGLLWHSISTKFSTRINDGFQYLLHIKKKLVEVIVGSSYTFVYTNHSFQYSQQSHTQPLLRTCSLDPGIGPTLLPSNARHAHNFTSFRLCVVALGYQGNPQLLRSSRGQSIGCEL